MTFATSASVALAMAIVAAVYSAAAAVAGYARKHFDRLLAASTHVDDWLRDAAAA